MLSNHTLFHKIKDFINSNLLNNNPSVGNEIIKGILKANSMFEPATQIYLQSLFYNPNEQIRRRILGLSFDIFVQQFSLFKCIMSTVFNKIWIQHVDVQISKDILSTLLYFSSDSVLIHIIEEQNDDAQRRAFCEIVHNVPLNFLMEHWNTIVSHFEFVLLRSDGSSRALWINQMKKESNFSLLAFMSYFLANIREKRYDSQIFLEVFAEAFNNATNYVEERAALLSKFLDTEEKHSLEEVLKSVYQKITTRDVLERSIQMIRSKIHANFRNTEETVMEYLYEIRPFSTSVEYFLLLRQHVGLLFSDNDAMRTLFALELEESSIIDDGKHRDIIDKQMILAYVLRKIPIRTVGEYEIDIREVKLALNLLNIYVKSDTREKTEALVGGDIMELLENFANNLKMEYGRRTDNNLKAKYIKIISLIHRFLDKNEISPISSSNARTCFVRL